MGVAIGVVSQEKFNAVLGQVRGRNFENAQVRTAMGIGQLQRVQGLFEQFQRTDDPLYSVARSWAIPTTYRTLATRPRRHDEESWTGNLVLGYQQQQWSLLDDRDLLQSTDRGNFFSLFSLEQGLFQDGFYLPRQGIPEPPERIEAFKGPPPVGVRPRPPIRSPQSPSGNSGTARALGAAALGLFVQSGVEYLLEPGKISIDAKGNIVWLLSLPPPAHLVAAPDIMTETDDFAINTDSLSRLSGDELCTLYLWVLGLLLQSRNTRPAFIGPSGETTIPDNGLLLKLIAELRKRILEKGGDVRQCLVTPRSPGIPQILFCQDVTVRPLSWNELFDATVAVLRALTNGGPLQADLLSLLGDLTTLLIPSLMAVPQLRHSTAPPIDHLGILTSLLERLTTLFPALLRNNLSVRAFDLALDVAVMRRPSDFPYPLRNAIDAERLRTLAPYHDFPLVSQHYQPQADQYQPQFQVP